MSKWGFRPWTRDFKEGTTLTLTAECESSEELAVFVETCKGNTTIKRVIFRESFLPLRRIRQHLTRKEFIQMLQSVARLASLEQMEIPPAMPGMLRGVTASYFLPDWPESDDSDDGEESSSTSEDEGDLSSTLRKWIVNDALTFCTKGDVDPIADQIEELCPNLHWIEMQNSYFKQFRGLSRTRQNCHNQSTNSNNTNCGADDSDDDERLMDPLFHALATLSKLTVFRLSGHPDYIPSDEVQATNTVQSPSFGIVNPRFIHKMLTQHIQSLQILTLERLGLMDCHMETIAASLPQMKVLESLSLNGNFHTTSGVMTLLLSLQHVQSHTLSSLCIRPEIRETDSYHQVGIDWNSIFVRNTALMNLEFYPTTFQGPTDCNNKHNGQNQNSLEFWLDLNRFKRYDWDRIIMTGPNLWPALLHRLGKHSVSAQ